MAGPGRGPPLKFHGGRHNLARDKERAVLNIEEEIRERNDEFHKAIANGDAEAMANNFATNGWFNHSGYPPVHGRDAIGEMFRQSVVDGLRGVKSYVISEIIEIGPGRSKSGPRLSLMSHQTGLSWRPR